MVTHPSSPKNLDPETEDSKPFLNFSNHLSVDIVDIFHKTWIIKPNLEPWILQNETISQMDVYNTPILHF
jgi:hypothetical protein